MLCLKFIARVIQYFEPTAPDLSDVVDNQYKHFVQEMDFGAEASAAAAADAEARAEASAADDSLTEALRDREAVAGL